MPDHDQTESVVKWKPLPDIPETPCGDVLFSGSPEALEVRACYSRIRGNRPRDLLMIFHRISAFAAYEEFADPWHQEQPAIPRCDSSDWGKYLFPLLEVQHSRWLRSLPSHVFGGDPEEYRHFTLGDINGNVHIITDDIPTKGWTVGWVDPLKDER